MSGKLKSPLFLFSSTSEQDWVFFTVISHSPPGSLKNFDISHARFACLCFHLFTYSLAIKTDRVIVSFANLVFRTISDLFLETRLHDIEAQQPNLEKISKHPYLWRHSSKCFESWQRNRPW